MPRLVVASNRVSVPRGRGSRAGGLEVAILDALRLHGGTWFGWSGRIAEATGGAATIATHGGVTYMTVDLGRADHERYYIGFANSTLWPLFHFRLGLVEYRREEYEGYLAVNARFAQLLAPALRPDDVVWEHDYHLIPLAAALREAGAQNRFGFFLHTPLPPADVLRSLPHHGDLMRALCAYDLVGFQTADDAGSFCDYVRRYAGGGVSDDGTIEAFGRRSRAAAFPISIDVEDFAATAKRAVQEADTRRLVEGLGGRALIVGVDRLDYSKGISKRFEAVRTLLTSHPELKRQFTYLQIAPLSRAEVREYRALRRQIEETSGRVNGAFAEFDWTPIRYVSRGLPRNTLAGFYREARVGLVTPFRDGMNLVAKEYVAAQRPDDPGVLVLSEFAGAARELSAALLVNPYDLDAMAEAMHRALTMPLEERRNRWQDLMAALRRNTIVTWREAYLDALTQPHVPALGASHAS